MSFDFGAAKPRAIEKKYESGSVSVSSNRIRRLRHSSMERWNPGRYGCLWTHPVNLNAGRPYRHDGDLHFHVL
jgi:hypothetical protein